MSPSRRKWMLLGIGVPIAGVLAWRFRVNAQIAAGLSQEDIEKLLLAARASGRSCEVHGVPLLPDRVGIRYGDMVLDDRDDESTHPNAHDYVHGGCVFGSRGTFAYVLYCPACRTRKTELGEVHHQGRVPSRSAEDMNVSHLLRLHTGRDRRSAPLPL